MSTVGAPAGFIEPPGDPGGVGGLAGAVGAAASAVFNTYDLARRLFQPPAQLPGGDWGSFNSGSGEQFQGPATDPAGGRWEGVPGATGVWIISLTAHRFINGEYRVTRFDNWHSGIPSTHTLIGPYWYFLSQNEYALEFQGSLNGNTIVDYVPNNTISGGPFIVNPITDFLLDIGARRVFIDPPTPPEPLPERERSAPPPVPQPNPSPNPSPAPAPPPVPQPNPSPNPGPGEPQPNPSPNPPPQPNPGPGEPQPNPNPQPQPNTFPNTPLPFPIPQPNNPTQTNPNGTTQAAPQTKPTTTPTDAHVVDNKVISNTGPQPSLDGIAKEVGRIESKLASVMKSTAAKDGPEWDEILGVLRFLKTIFDGITDDEPQSAYQISSPCELDDQEQRIIFASTIAASTDKFGAIINRINAVADLLQHSKNLKQPLCPGQRFPVSGQAVTVNFTQID